jgi:HxlR-like helix-turn-helix
MEGQLPALREGLQLVESHQPGFEAPFTKIEMRATSNVLAGKWKVLIVWHLSFKSRRFAEIRDVLPGVSEKAGAPNAAVQQERESDDREALSDALDFRRAKRAASF